MVHARPCTTRTSPTRCAAQCTSRGPRRTGVTMTGPPRSSRTTGTSASLASTSVAHQCAPELLRVSRVVLAPARAHAQGHGLGHHLGIDSPADRRVSLRGTRHCGGRHDPTGHAPVAEVGVHAGPGTTSTPVVEAGLDDDVVVADNPREQVCPGRHQMLLPPSTVMT